MDYSLPFIDYRHFQRSPRRKSESGWVLGRVQVSLAEIDAYDAPVAVRFRDRHQQDWDVRHYNGQFYVACSYDGLSDASCLTQGELASGAPEHARPLAMMLRPLMRANNSNLDYETCVALFKNWKTVPQEQAEFLGTQIVDLDQVPTLVMNGTVTRTERFFRDAYAANIIIDNEVYRRCCEPRFILSHEVDYDPEQLTIRVEVEVDPQLPGEFSGLRREVYPCEAWERPSLRIDRFDEIRDLVDLYGWTHGNLILDLPASPQVIIDNVLLYDDEADMLLRTAQGVLSDGHSELMWVESETINRWAVLKEKIKAVTANPATQNLEALCVALQRYEGVIYDEQRSKIINATTARFDTRPVSRHQPAC